MKAESTESETRFLKYLENARASKQIDDFVRPDRSVKDRPQPDFEIIADGRKYFIEVYQSGWLTKDWNKIAEQQQKIANYVNEKRLPYPYWVAWYQRDILLREEGLIPKLARYIEELCKFLKGKPHTDSDWLDQGFLQLYGEYWAKPGLPNPYNDDVICYPTTDLEFCCFDPGIGGPISDSPDELYKVLDGKIGEAQLKNVGPHPTALLFFTEDPFAVRVPEWFLQRLGRALYGSEAKVEWDTQRILVSSEGTEGVFNKIRHGFVGSLLLMVREETFIIIPNIYCCKHHRFQPKFMKTVEFEVEFTGMR